MRPHLEIENFSLCTLYETDNGLGPSRQLALNTLKYCPLNLFEEK